MTEDWLDLYLTDNILVKEVRHVGWPLRFARVLYFL